MFLRGVIATTLALAALSTLGAEVDSAVVFGQIRLGGKEAIVAPYRLTARNVDTGKLERIHLTQREPTSVIYDFAEPLPAGKYYLLNMAEPRSNAEYRIGDAKSPFEIPAGATVYIGTWTVKLGVPTTTYTIDYDMAEIGLFAKANPQRDMAKFMIGAPGKQAIPLKAQ
jgi:hypothetical protein